MDNFYEILDLLYKFNKKWPELSFGRIMHNLITTEEKIFYLPDIEIIKRLKYLVNEEYTK
jgi:hypothetical protein